MTMTAVYFGGPKSSNSKTLCASVTRPQKKKNTSYNYTRYFPMSLQRVIYQCCPCRWIFWTRRTIQRCKLKQQVLSEICQRQTSSTSKMTHPRPKKNFKKKGDIVIWAMGFGTSTTSNERSEKQMDTYHAFISSWSKCMYVLQFFHQEQNIRRWERKIPNNLKMKKPI